MKRIALLSLLLASFAQTLSAWNFVGHQVVAGIAWDHMTPEARRNAIALLSAAPGDACLVELMPNDDRPRAIREREFFMKAAVWADNVRPRDDDQRACSRYHRPSWHFINYFWEGISGATDCNPPVDRRDIRTPDVNAVERLEGMRPIMACTNPRCGITDQQRAITLAWILHLVGDIHQPLHTSARVTTARGEHEGDQGGNLFKFSEDRSLHSFWDNIVNNHVPRLDQEQDAPYFNRVIAMITAAHPRATYDSAEMKSGAFEAWAREGFATTKAVVYPVTLQRNVPPSDAYRQRAFEAASPALALAGYRLADLLNQLLG